jgi:hypothetical protein
MKSSKSGKHFDFKFLSLWTLKNTFRYKLLLRPLCLYFANCVSSLGYRVQIMITIAHSDIIFCESQPSEKYYHEKSHNRFLVRPFPLLIKVNPSTILRCNDVYIRIRKCDGVSHCGNVDDVVAVKAVTFCQARYKLLRKKTNLSDPRRTINTVIVVKICPHATKFDAEKNP